MHGEITRNTDNQFSIQPVNGRYKVTVRKDNIKDKRIKFSFIIYTLDSLANRTFTNFNQYF